MSVRSHHWAIDRHARVEAILRFIKDNPGIEERKLITVMRRKLRTSPRAIREYLSELVEYEGIEKRDAKLYPGGYEEKETEKSEEDIE